MRKIFLRITGVVFIAAYLLIISWQNTSFAGVKLKRRVSSEPAQPAAAAKEAVTTKFAPSEVSGVTSIKQKTGVLSSAINDKASHDSLKPSQEPARKESPPMAPPRAGPQGATPDASITLKVTVVNSSPAGTIIINNADASTESLDADLRLSVSDPNFINVAPKLLLHCDGQDGAGLFSDEAGKTVIASTVTTSTAVKKFGTASAAYHNIADYLQVAQSDDWDVGIGDFTIDFWVNFNTFDAKKLYYLFEHYSPPPNRYHQLRLGASNSADKRLYYDCTDPNGKIIVSLATSALPLNAGTWYHIAVVRNGHVLTIYLNGVSQISGDMGATAIADIAGGMDIGNNISAPIACGLDGYIDEFRWSKGIAIWKSNFTPSSQPYSLTETQMQLSNDNINWSVFEDFAPTKSWRLTSGYGTKTVYARFKNGAGNISGVISDTIEVVKAADKERIYIYLNGQRVAMEENGKKSFYHNDHLGGTNVVTDASGAQVKYVDYKPFGDTKTEQGSLTVCKKFTSKELDDSTGLYDYGARQYDAKTGRFITPDPLEILLTQKANVSKAALGFRFKNTTEQNLFVALLYNPQNLNKYSYCLNNPINYTDPLGLWVGIGERKALKRLPGEHTVIILRPDNQKAFKNDKSFPWYINNKGAIEGTLGANPNWRFNFDSTFGNLKSYPSNEDDRPTKLKNIQQIQDPLKRSDTQLIRDILSSAQKYQNNLPYDPIPEKGDPSMNQAYNSNSYVRGVLKDVGIVNPPNLGGWIPGWNTPIPLNEREKRK